MPADTQWWTHCTSADKVISFNQYLSAAVWTAPFAAITIAIAASSGEPWCVLIAIEVSMLVWLCIYCDWWLNLRLVCLGTPAPGDGETVSAVGVVINFEKPDDKSWPGSLDSDYSVNLLLPPGEPGVSRAMAVAQVPYGVLIAENAITQSQGLMTPGNQAKDEETQKSSEALHVEFEGPAIHDLQVVSLIALVAAVAALLLCMSGIGAIVAYILAILAFLAALFGAALSPLDRGSPSDAGIPSIERNNGDGKGATILGVTGRWVYDAGHLHDSFNSAQNEIHPILSAEVVGHWDGQWPPNIDTINVDYVNGYKEANSPQTKDAQTRPEWKWKIHPSIDGCAPPTSPAPDIR